jgi:hypothetical protein
MATIDALGISILCTSVHTVYVRLTHRNIGCEIAIVHLITG